MAYISNNFQGAPVIDFGTVDAVLADFDDTLVDYRKPCRAGLELVRRRFRELEEFPVESLEMEYGKILRENLPALFDGSISVNDEIEIRMAGILRKHGLEPQPDDVKKSVRLFNEGFWKTRNLVDGAMEFLEMCRSYDIPVAIVTNGNLEIQMRSSKMLGITDYIEAMLTPQSSLEMKPGSAMFERALDITGARRSRTVMIGDTWQHDIVGAINAGIKPVWLNIRGEEQPEGPGVDAISSLREITGNYSYR